MPHIPQLLVFFVVDQGDPQQDRELGSVVSACSVDPAEVVGYTLVRESHHEEEDHVDRRSRGVEVRLVEVVSYLEEVPRRVEHTVVEVVLHTCSFSHHMHLHHCGIRHQHIPLDREDMAPADLGLRAVVRTDLEDPQTDQDVVEMVQDGPC